MSGMAAMLVDRPDDLVTNAGLDQCFEVFGHKLMAEMHARAPRADLEAHHRHARGDGHVGRRDGHLRGAGQALTTDSRARPRP